MAASNPSRVELEAQIIDVANILEKIADAGSVDATNLVTLYDALEQSMESDFAAAVLNELEGIRDDIAGTITSSSAAAALRPLIQAYAYHVIGRLNAFAASDGVLLSEMYDFRRRNALFVQSRVITFGSPTAEAANIGTTKITRLTKDSYNFDIEACWVEQKRARCISDSNTGTNVGSESWLFEGQALLKDELRRSGSGLEVVMPGQTVDNSILENAGFQGFAGTAAAPSGINNWVSSGGDTSSIYTFDSTETFRKQPQVATTAPQFSLRLRATTNLTQLLTVSGQELDVNVPYIFVVIWRRDAGVAATGTLTLNMANISRAITVDALSGWQVSIVPSAVDWATWYTTFQQEAIQFGINWTRTTGDIHIAEALMLRGRRFDNHWYWVLPNDTAKYVAPRVNDEFLITDTGGTTSLLQKWFWKAYSVWMPHSNGSSIDWTDS